MFKNNKFEFATKQPKIISFVGMMGAGKTKFGTFLSKKLKYRFYDVDKKIQQKFNQTINDIFKNFGEDFFRDEENKITTFIVNKIIKEGQNSIISLGGGGFNNQKTQNEDIFSKTILNEDNQLEFPDVNTYLHDNVD